MANNGMDQIKATYATRGSEYKDTMEHTQWLQLISIADTFGLKITNDQARAIAIAGLVDIKYWRSLGGFKKDNLIDGASYTAYLIGELDHIKNSGKK